MSWKDISRRGVHFEKFLQTRRCPRNHIKTRSTFHRTFGDISLSWNIRIHIRTRTTHYRFFQIFRWYLLVLKHISRRLSRDYIIFETSCRTRRCHKKMYQDEEYSSKNSMISSRLEICSEDDSSPIRFLWKISQDEKMSWKDVSRREVHFNRIW